MRGLIYTATTNKLDVVDQHSVLLEYARNQNIQVIRSLSDADIWNRPAKSLLGINGVLRCAEERSIEIVLIHDMSVFGQNLSHMLNLVMMLSKHKVGVYFYRENLTTHGTDGIETLKVLAHLEACDRLKFTHKVRHGMQQAKSEGVRLGRPSLINANTESCVVTLRGHGMSIANIAKTVKIGIGSVYKILKNADALECA